MKIKNKKRKNRYKSKYQAGGMYADNTIQAAGQGVKGSTANIVFNESNPAVLAQKLKFLSDQKAAAQQSSDEMAQSVAQQDQVDKQSVAAAKAASDAKFEQGESLVTSGLDKVEEYGEDAKGYLDKLEEDKATKGAEKALAANKAVDVGSEFVTQVPGSELGAPLNIQPGGGSADLLTSFNSPAPTLPPSAPYVPPSSNIPVQVTPPPGAVASKGVDLSKATVDGASAGGGLKAGLAAYKAQRATNEAIKAGTLMQSSAGSAAGAGWGAMSSSAKGGIIGTAATLAGEGLKKWGGDDDDTELNTAEWSGELLSGAGTGIGVATTAGTVAGMMGAGALYGSAVPGLGTAIGAVAGLGYGAYKALAGRKKARKAEADALAAKKKRVGKYNKKVTEGLGSAVLSAQQGEMDQKTYSGYDLGRDYVAQRGGMRMGMPRYGYAS